MKMLNGPALAQELRKISDEAKERALIVSPYIGKWSAVKALLGSSWWLGSALQLRVITDTSQGGNVNQKTLEKLAGRGTVRSLAGIHAKIYILGNRAIVTSANLTETAFTKRREVGFLLKDGEAKPIVQLFEDWWIDSKPINVSQVKTSWKIRLGADDAEPGGQNLPKLWELPTAPPESEFAQKGETFSRYQAFLKCYGKLATEYASNQRLLQKAPLFIEVDTFLNFLYHNEAVGTPSRSYRNTNKGRELTPKQRVAEVVKWAAKFAKSLDVREEIQWRADNSSELQFVLRKEALPKLTWKSVRDVVGHIHAMNAYNINKARFLNPENNSIQAIRKSWTRLLYGTESEQDKINNCDAELDGFGTSSIQELLGWVYPQKYPLKNANSDAGLRFFGFHF